MNQRASATAARDFVAALGGSTSGEGVDVERVRVAVFKQTFDFVPESAVAAVVRPEGADEPLLLAVDGDQLYALNVASSQDQDDPWVECRLLHIRPGSGTVKARTQYRRSMSGDAWRYTEWRFELADELAFTIKANVADGELHGREVFPHTLASALGWKFNVAQDV